MVLVQRWSRFSSLLLVCSLPINPLLSIFSATMVVCRIAKSFSQKKTGVQCNCLDLVNKTSVFCLESKASSQSINLSRSHRLTSLQGGTRGNHTKRGKQRWTWRLALSLVWVRCKPMENLRSNSNTSHIQILGWSSIKKYRGKHFLTTWGPSPRWYADSSGYTQVHV